MTRDNNRPRITKQVYGSRKTGAGGEQDLSVIMRRGVTGHSSRVMNAKWKRLKNAKALPRHTNIIHN